MEEESNTILEKFIEDNGIHATVFETKAELDE